MAGEHHIIIHGLVDFFVVKMRFGLRYTRSILPRPRVILILVLVCPLIIFVVVILGFFSVPRL